MRKHRPAARIKIYSIHLKTGSIIWITKHKQIKDILYWNWGIWLFQGTTIFEGVSVPHFITKVNQSVLCPSHVWDAHKKQTNSQRRHFPTGSCLRIVPGLFVNKSYTFNVFSGKIYEAKGWSQKADWSGGISITGCPSISWCQVESQPLSVCLRLCLYLLYSWEGNFSSMATKQADSSSISRNFD